MRQILDVRLHATFPAKKLTADGGDDLAAMFLLGGDPASHLVEVLRVHGGAELVDLHHGLADGRAGLLDLRDGLPAPLNS